MLLNTVNLYHQNETITIKINIMSTKQFLFQIAEKIMQENSMSNIYRVIASVKEFYLQDAELAKNAEQHAIDTVKIVMRTLTKI